MTAPAPIRHPAPGTRWVGADGREVVVVEAGKPLTTAPFNIAAASEPDASHASDEKRSKV